MTSATTSSLVGRADELGRLLGLLDRAERGRPAVGLIAGDAGVGKTRLLDELAARAGGAGVRVLVGGCMEVGDVGLPYVPFVDAFRDLGTRPGEAEVATPLTAALPSLGRLLPELATESRPVPPPGDGFERVQLFDGVLSLLGRLSELAPLLLVIEDLHWADRSTRDLLAFLVRTLRGGRVALVASYRTDELHRRHPLRPLLAELVRLPDLERIELAPFGRAELAEHLQAVAGQPVPPAVVDRILARSEGNAFFAEELVAAGAIRADIALPDALADVLLGRIEALSELAQEVLKVAAVAGRRVGHQLLVAASGRPEAEVERGLRDAIAGQVLVASAATESYRFRHALLQEAVYGDLLPGERTRLHATYARLLAAGDPEGDDPSASAAELAWHCLASHDLPGGLAALVRAADQAANVFAPSEAYRHLTQALELWHRVPDAAAVAGVDRVEVLVRAAEAANHSGEFRQAVGLAREAVEAIDEEAEPLRAATAYDRLSGYLLDAEPERGPGRGADAGRLRAGGRAGPGGAADPAAGPGRGRAGPLAARGPRLRGGQAPGRGGAGHGQGRRQRRRRGQGPDHRVDPGAALRRRGDGPGAAARRRPGGRRRRQPAAGAPGPPRPRGVRARPRQPGRGLHRPGPGDRAGRAQRPGLERLRDRQPGAALHRPLLGRELGRGRAGGRRGRRAPAGGVGGRPVRRGRPGPRRGRPSGWPASPPTARPTRTSPIWPAAARPTWPAGRATWSAPASWPARPCRPRRRPARPGC